MKKSIYQIINSKNKNCKKCDKTAKNGTYTSKMLYKKIKPTKIDLLIKQIYFYPPEVFPEYVFTDNKEYIINLSIYLSKKINLQISKFRSLKHTTIIEFVAKDCAKQILTNEKIDIIKYINKQYGFDCFYKKEVTILPALIVTELLNIMFKMHNELQVIACNVKQGASAKRYSSKCSYSDGAIYGIFKYNKNLLKFTQISYSFVQKCVFNLIDKLNRYYNKLQVILNYIRYLDRQYINHNK